jgi:hypothetical protein
MDILCVLAIKYLVLVNVKLSNCIPYIIQILKSIGLSILIIIMRSNILDHQIALFTSRGIWNNMLVSKNTIPACCGKISIMFKLDRPISVDLLNFLVANGFEESPNFLKSGILFAHNSVLTVTGALGSDKLQVKCQLKDCDQKLNELEGLLLLME